MHDFREFTYFSEMFLLVVKFSPICHFFIVYSVSGTVQDDEEAATQIWDGSPTRLSLTRENRYVFKTHSLLSEL